MHCRNSVKYGNYIKLEKNYEIEIKGFEIPVTNGFNITRRILQKILHFILIGLMMINGGVFYTTMTPNIMLTVRKK